MLKDQPQNIGGALNGTVDAHSNQETLTHDTSNAADSNNETLTHGTSFDPYSNHETLTCDFGVQTSTVEMYSAGIQVSSTQSHMPCR